MSFEMLTSGNALYRCMTECMPGAVLQIDSILP